MIDFASAQPSPAKASGRPSIVVDLVATKASDDIVTFRGRMTLTAARTLRDELAMAIGILEERAAVSGGG